MGRTAQDWLSQDPERLRRFREGDRAVLSEVFRVYAPAVAGSLRRGMLVPSGGRTYKLQGLRSSFEVDDLVQEVFSRALRPSARERYDGARPYTSYLLGIARNLLVDSHHAALREVAATEAPVEAWSASSDAANRSPETQAMAGELRALFDGFVATLEEKDRVLLTLRLGARAPRREVSERTGLSAMQVRSRESRLRHRLFSVLSARGYGEGPLATAAAGRTEA